MGFSYNVNVLNQKGSPAIYTDTFANRPAFGFAGRLFIANDTAAIYEDIGTAWVLIANVSSGAGTLQQVTTNGNTSNVGISVTAGGVSTNSATITSLTQGSVPFVGAAGLITQDNANLFFDDTNNRLGINTNTPGNSLDVHTAGTNPILALNNTAGNQSAISFLNNSVQKWRVGNTATDTFDIFNPTNSTIAISIDSGSTLKLITSPKIKNNTGLSPEAGFGAIGFLTSGVIFQRDNSANKLFFDFSGFTAQRTYLCPNTDGTLALTSNIPTVSGTTDQVSKFTGSTSIGDSIITATSTNVGIGTTTPTSISTFTTLEIRGATGGGIKIGETGLPQLNIHQDGLDAYINNTANGDIYFYTNDTDRGKLSKLGNFCFGSIVDDTVNKLQVTGSIAVSGDSNLKGNITIDKATPAITMEGRNSGNSGTQLKFLGWNAANPNWLISVANFGNGLDLSVSTANGGSTFTAAIGSFDKTTGIYTAVSDINKKKDFEDSLIGLNAILGLKPTLYRMFNEENTNKHLGFIAQEVKDFIPQAYVESGEKENIFIGLNFQAITTTLVKAVQEQQNIIESLIQRIELLENK